MRTYDLVVLGAEWGHGRRQGWLSNLHLGAREPGTGEFVMVGKCFKGLTDELLRVADEELLERETGRRGIAVFVRPELVVEIALDGVQSSTRYPGGVALRFARVKRYRPDKSGAAKPTRSTTYAACSGRAPPDSGNTVCVRQIREGDLVSGKEMRDGVPLTNLDEPLFEGADATKRDLVDYLDAIADRIIPELTDRPLSVVRAVRGQAPFMQKNVPKYTPPWVQTVSFWAETSKRDVSYALCNDRRTLMWFANQRAVEYHPTLIRADRGTAPPTLCSISTRRTRTRSRWPSVPPSLCNRR